MNLTEMSHQPMDESVLLRYLSGRATAADIQVLGAWLSEKEENREELRRIERAWELLGADRAQVEVDADVLWDRIRAGIEDATVVGPSAPARDVKRSLRLVKGAGTPSRRRTFLRGAAVAALAAAALLYVKMGVPAADQPVAQEFRTYATNAGERLSLTFPDGSVAILSGESTLRLPHDFGEGSRDVHLDGEAYFEVTHDSVNAFRVHTSRMVAQVLGTRFSVTAYSSDASELVAVAEGAVSVVGSSDSVSVILRPNDMVRLSPAGQLIPYRSVQVDQFFNWTRGLVEFDQARLAEAARRIERNFGVEVNIADSALAERRFTGSVRAFSLYADLQGIAVLLDATYSRDGNRVVLGSRR
jgi:transmembrane sensor